MSLGDSVSKALSEKGLFVDYQAKSSSWQGIFEMMKKISKKEKKTQFFYPRSLQAENHYFAEIKKMNIPFKEVSFYETKPIFWNEASWKLFHELDAMVLGSPSAINALNENFIRKNYKVFRHPAYILLGKTSEKRFLDFRQHWMQKFNREIFYAVVDHPSPKGVIECLEKYFKK